MPPCASARILRSARRLLRASFFPFSDTEKRSAAQTQAGLPANRKLFLTAGVFQQGKRRACGEPEPLLVVLMFYVAGLRAHAAATLMLAELLAVHRFAQ